MLRIFADENIPAVEEMFSQIGRVTTIPALEIRRKALLEADVLLVRSVTQVDAGLVKGTPVRFVGTATAGTDHVDLNALAEQGIEFASAPGSNATSVCDYVVASVLRLAADEGRRLDDLTCLVIGCGAVGGRVARRLEHLGLSVLRSDPPLDDVLQTAGKESPYVDTGEAIPQADIITLHVPLHGDPYSTYSLLDAEKLAAARRAAWIINTSRGAVIDEDDLLGWLAQNEQARVVIDVWNNEPNLSCDLVRRASIATAHIAGYALEGKLRATLMLREALAEWTGRNIPDWDHLTKPIDLRFESRAESTERRLNDLVRSVYDIGSDDRALRPICNLDPADHAAHFEAVRRRYPLRHEFGQYRISASSVPQDLRKVVTEGVGMRLG